MESVIEVVSDVICPWCYIGKRRLEKALSLMGRTDAVVRWKAFELNPGAPREGMDRREYRMRKFGSLAYSQQLEARVASAGASEGIDFRFDRIVRVPNTFEAHRLIWLAGRDGAQDAVVEQLFRAYFLEGEDLGDPAVLRRIGRESGIELSGDEGAREVSEELSAARARGVTGVPSFFVDGRPVASGAHPAELMASFLGPVLARAGEQCRMGETTCE
jgi:predicted DsbA family dithiol-disulfide isomerase